MSQDTAGSVSARLRALRGFAFDLDGTIWEGPRLMPGAEVLVDDLRGSGIKVVFASNSSRACVECAARPTGRPGDRVGAQ